VRAENITCKNMLVQNYTKLLQKRHLQPLLPLLTDMDGKFDVFSKSCHTGVTLTYKSAPNALHMQGGSGARTAARSEPTGHACWMNRQETYPVVVTDQFIRNYGSVATCCLLWFTMVRFHPWFSPRIRVVSRVLDQKLMCAPKEKTQDQIRNTMSNRKAEFPRRVLSRCCVILRACGNNCISPWRNMRAPCKQSCQWDVNLVGASDQNMEQFVW